MKLIISFFILILLGFSYSKAQVTISKLNVDYVNQPKDGNVKMAYDTIYNSSSVDVQISWKFANFYAPTGWEITGVCDNKSCNSVSDTSTFKPTVPANSYMVIYSDVSASTTAQSGCAVARINVTIPGQGKYTIQFTHTDGADATVCYTLGVTNIKKIDAKVFPNPTSNGLSVSYNNNEAYTAQLFDIYGKAVYSTNINTHNNFINTSNLSAGMYMLKLVNTANEVVYAQKISKL